MGSRNDPEFRAALTRVLAKHQLSMTDLAAILGVTVGTVSRWKSGELNAASLYVDVIKAMEPASPASVSIAVACSRQGQLAKAVYYLNSEGFVREGAH